MQALLESCPPAIPLQGQKELSWSAPAEVADADIDAGAGFAGNALTCTLHGLCRETRLQKVVERLLDQAERRRLASLALGAWTQLVAEERAQRREAFVDALGCQLRQAKHRNEMLLGASNLGDSSAPVLLQRSRSINLGLQLCLGEFSNAAHDLEDAEEGHNTSGGALLLLLPPALLSQAVLAAWFAAVKQVRQRRAWHQRAQRAALAQSQSCHEGASWCLARCVWFAWRSALSAPDSSTATMHYAPNSASNSGDAIGASPTSHRPCIEDAWACARQAWSDCRNAAYAQESSGEASESEYPFSHPPASVAPSTCDFVLDGGCQSSCQHGSPSHSPTPCRACSASTGPVPSPVRTKSSSSPTARMISAGRLLPWERAVQEMEKQEHLARQRDPVFHGSCQSPMPHGGVSTATTRASSPGERRRRDTSLSNSPQAAQSSALSMPRWEDMEAEAAQGALIVSEAQRPFSRGPERFFYDKSSYTGCARFGGPSVLDKPSSAQGRKSIAGLSTPQSPLRATSPQRLMSPSPVTRQSSPQLRRQAPSLPLRQRQQMGAARSASYTGPLLAGNG